MTAQLSPLPVFKAWDNAGIPLNGGKLFTYVAGSTTKQASYTDSTAGTPNPNPVILNYRGEANVWLDPTKVYKLVLAPANDTDPPTNPFWTVDQISGGILSPTGSIIPTVDNLFTLGNTSFSWANVYVGPNHAPILGASGIVGYYPRTAAEIALSVTPTDFSYPADPYVDPRRYGADPTGVSVSTTAVQTAINVAVSCNGMVWIGNKCTFLCGALTVTYSGTQFANGLRIMGSAANGSAIKISGTPTALLTITATSMPAGFPFTLENFSIIGATVGAITTIGVQLNGLAQFMIRGMVIQGCQYAIQSLSCLTYTIEDCILANNSATGSVNGIHIRGASVTANMCKIERNTISGWAGFAIDFDQGTMLIARANDIEQNGGGGTGANSGGGIHIGSSLEPGFGEAQITLHDNWLEGNFGWGIKVDAPTNGSSNQITIRGGWVISPQSSFQGVLISGATQVSIEDFKAPDAAGNIVNITANNGFYKNCGFNTFTDATLRPTYINVATPGGTRSYGKSDNFTGTLTGCTTSPTGNVAITLQGNEIDLDFLGSITGISNTTAATITGLPSKYWPAADTIGSLMTQNNGANSTMPCQVAAATGIITLGFAVGFAAAGGKGVVGGRLSYRLS